MLTKPCPALHLLALALAGACAGPEQLGDPRLPTLDEADASGPAGGLRNGIVTASSPAAAEAGSRVLAAGGDAVDAAAVVQLMLNVVEPQSSGLGGGGFLLIYRADEDRTYVIDAAERAPAAATADMFADQPSAEVRASSGAIVGVPGTLKGLAAALDRWGTLTLAEAVGPALLATQRGVRVSEALAADSRDERLDHEIGNPYYDEARAVFRPGDEPLRPGESLHQPGLARTLRQLRERGVAAFHDCDDPAGIAAAIVDAQRATRASNPGGAGRMTCDDLAAYDVVLREPLVRAYRDYTVVTAPPPSAGGVGLLQMLAVLERFPLGADGLREHDADTLGLMQEAMRLAYADRGLWIGDPDVVPLPLAGLLSDAYLHERAELVQLGTRAPEIVAGDPRAHDPTIPDDGTVARVPGDTRGPAGHTTHFNVVDGAGNIVSWTSTISSTWGSGLMVPGFGFMLNDSLANFNHRPARSADPRALDPGANDVAPNKRPRSSMAPTLLLLDGDPVAAYGAAGGSTILSTLLTLTIDLIDHGMTLREAIDEPRLSLESGSADAVTTIEPDFDLETLTDLRRRGYSFDVALRLGAAQGVILYPATGEQYGAADPRRQGGVAGPP